MPLFVTVTPGTTVSSTTTLSASTLNLLGTPSVDITGSVDGGTLSVADGSLTLAKFAPISGSRLIGNGNAVSAYPAELSSTDLAFTASTINIGTGAVTTAKLADSSSSATGVTYAKIQHVTDARLLGRSQGTNGVPQEISVGAGLTLASGALTNGILRYTTSAKSIPVLPTEPPTVEPVSNQGVQWLTTASELPSLSVAPQMVRVVLECFTNDGPFVPTNEVDIQSVVMQGFQSNFPVFNYAPTVSSGVVSGSNIFLNVWFTKREPGNGTPYASVSDSKMFVLTSAGAYQELTRANWKVKAYLLYASTWA
jgi:hypothetical protein